MEARYGLSPGAFGGTFEEYVSRVHPDDRDSVVQGVAAVRDSEGDLMSEHRVVWPDGTVHWIEARGRALHDDRRRLRRDGRCRHRHRRAQAARSLDDRRRRSCARPPGSSATCRRPSASPGSGAGAGKPQRTPSRLSAEMARMLASDADDERPASSPEALQRAAHPDDGPELTRSANEALTQWPPPVRDGVPARRERQTSARWSTGARSWSTTTRRSSSQCAGRSRTSPNSARPRPRSSLRGNVWRGNVGRWRSSRRR